MAGESGYPEVDEAVRALQAVVALLDRPADGTTDPAMDAMVALEAARTAHEQVSNLVRLLTERALRQGASFRALGYDFVDPYD